MIWGVIAGSVLTMAAGFMWEAGASAGQPADWPRKLRRRFVQVLWRQFALAISWRRTNHALNEGIDGLELSRASASLCAERIAAIDADTLAGTLTKATESANTTPEQSFNKSTCLGEGLCPPQIKRFCLDRRDFWGG